MEEPEHLCLIKDVSLFEVVSMFQDMLETDDKLRPIITFETFSISVADSGYVMIRFKNGYGFLTNKGNIYATKSIEHIMDELIKLSKDTVMYYSNYGNKTMKCCFCCLPLTNDMSCAKSCANKYGIF